MIGLERGDELWANDRWNPGRGSYGVSVVWDPAVAPTPGVIVQQPDRPPVPVVQTKPKQPPAKDCTEPAAKLLECLGLDDPDVKRVRVKSVSLKIDLKHDKDCDCCN